MSGKRKRRIWLWLALLIVAALILFLLLGQTEQRQVPLITAVPVSRENLNTLISSNGKVEPIEPQAIQARLSAFVEKVLVAESQSVKQGQLLLILDGSETLAELARTREELVVAEDELRSARAGGRADDIAQVETDLRKTESQLARLRQERETLERLLAKQAATQEERDQNALALDRVEAELQLLQKRKEELARRARFDVERATLRIQQAQEVIHSLEQKAVSARVSTPIDGILYSLPVRAGNFVRVGDLLAELADLRRVRVRAFVDEPELARLAIDQPVEITWDAYPNRLWMGRVERIPSAVVSRGARSVGEVLCSIQNERLELLPNVNVNVRILVHELPNSLVVPRAAVLAEGMRRYVFVVEGDKLRKREIKVGIVNATKYQVVEGLAEGNRVALPQEVEVRDGLTVRVAEQK
ncbi:MAG: efflux RND transporter periplasmic adaptor subunit [Acidobacteria bacterium]|nr:efflux RND transporter periplasmic adaptor subunit [Acidobacteriota bacterium]